MHKNIKTSYGIALCRYNISNNNRVEILMIKKRYTYHYFYFVFGYYNKSNNKYLQYLFNNMTFSEKLEILSMKFSNIWYRLWNTDYSNCNDRISNISKPDDKPDQRNLKCYFRKKSKFESIFTRDCGKRLRRLINNSTNSATPWEIPKGIPEINETNLDCACREFREETNIPNNSYTILWNIKPIIITYIDDDVMYRSIYYIASYNKYCTWIPKISFNIKSQINEIEQIKWVSLNEIEFLNLNPSAKKRLFQLFKKISRKYNKIIKNYNFIPIKNQKSQLEQQSKLNNLPLLDVSM